MTFVKTAIPYGILGVIKEIFLWIANHQSGQSVPGSSATVVILEVNRSNVGDRAFDIEWETSNISSSYRAMKQACYGIAQ